MNEQPISEREVENWRLGLTECSFDKRDKLDGPTREVIGTENERFIVTKLEINKGISMVRRFASIASMPTKWTVPGSLTPTFNTSKALFALMLSIEFTIKQLVFYSDHRLSHYLDELAEVEDKLTKLTRFADTIRAKLLELQRQLGNPDIKEEQDEAPAIKSRPISLMPHRQPREKKVVRAVKKKFSLADALDDEE